MSDDVTISTQGGACRIELNRHDCANLVTMEMVKSLTQMIATIASDVRLVVIAGRGRDFCKGRDYQAAPESAAAGRTAPSALRIREEMTGPMMAFYSALRDLPVPTLSIVQGAAYGFGCALAGACDMTLADESAVFKLPEMGRGLPPTLAMSALWDRVPPPRPGLHGLLHRGAYGAGGACDRARQRRRARSAASDTCGRARRVCLQNAARCAEGRQGISQGSALDAGTRPRRVWRERICGGAVFALTRLTITGAQHAVPHMTREFFEHRHSEYPAVLSELCMVKQ